MWEVESMSETKQHTSLSKIWNFFEMKLLFAYVLFSVVGIMVFPVFMIAKGITWWEIAGSMVSFLGCCLPMILEYRDTHKLDLRPRFMK